LATATRSSNALAAETLYGNQRKITQKEKVVLPLKLLILTSLILRLKRVKGRQFEMQPRYIREGVDL